MPSDQQALFDEIIDYAGLFPPARLPMTEAFARFDAHRNSADGWLLARFVCPAQRLAELTPLVRASSAAARPVRIAVLGTGGDDPPSYAAGMEGDLETMSVFAAQAGGGAIIDAFEVKLPKRGDLADTVDFTCDLLAVDGADPPMPYFEVSLLGEWSATIDPAVTAVAAAIHEIDGAARRAGLKIRCGGLDAAAVPTIDAVAAAVVACRDAGLPLKATQGLHHPIRRPDPELGATVHGFVNLLAASVFAHTSALAETEIRAILADDDPAVFAVSATALRWRDLEAGAEAIADGRTNAFTSFGSCSFAEPRDDLAELGWLKTNCE